MDTFDKLDHIAFGAITETYGHITDAEAEVLAEKIANRINNSFAVVELPSPDREALSHNGVGWTVPAPHWQVYDGYFQIESSDSEFGEPDTAEAVGVALIACARYRRDRIAQGLPSGTAGRETSEVQS